MNLLAMLPDKEIDIGGNITHTYIAEAKHQHLIKELEARLAAAVDALEFTVHAAEYLYKPDKILEKNLCPTFYFTLTYEGDLELINKTKHAREALKAAGEGV